MTNSGERVDIDAPYQIADAISHRGCRCAVLDRYVSACLSAVPGNV